MILMYWDIGRMIEERQKLRRLGLRGHTDAWQGHLQSELAEVKGFSERNLKRMTQFYMEYPVSGQLGHRPVAQLERA